MGERPGLSAGRSGFHFRTIKPAFAQFAKSSREPLPASMATRLMNREPAGIGTSNRQAGDSRRITRCIHALSVERDCAESQSQQHLRLAATPNLPRLVLRTQPRSGLTGKFTDNLWLRAHHRACRGLLAIDKDLEDDGGVFRVRAKINSGFARGIMASGRGTNDLPAPKPPAATSAAQARGSGEASEHTSRSVTNESQRNNVMLS